MKVKIVKNITMRSQLCLPLSLLFLACGVLTSAQNSSTIAPVTEPTQELVNYEALKYIVGRPFNLNCTLAVPLDSFEIVWKKNSVPLGEVAGLKERYELQNKGLTFQIKGRSNEDDYGNYTCGLKNQTGHIKAWMVTGNVHAKMTKDANVVEGQNIKITCKLIGKPYSEVTWKYKKDELDNGTDVSAVLGSRVQLEKNEQGLDNTVLVLQNAERADAGLYQCSPAGGTPADVTLRVKGVYDALWPFLGICAEVVVLCAVILFYEKRRTKPELDDSDTDNHDQKKS
ncbi:basigin isoform X2 [Bombyx mori]|uniref:Ig-like domain-containing protein n=1 Tax=Bombyx mori TaxID=7091 RepID=A0A8R2M4D4_BOMMO|nr:basigin isoform X2 [Bombyx mori]